MPATEFSLTDALLIASAVLVFTMQGGFCMLEAGVVRSKNAVHVAVKNLFDICLVSIAFIAVGFGLAFGATRGGLVGSPFGPFDSGPGSGSLLSLQLYHVMFCGAAATIVSGAVAERIRTKAYLATTVVIACLVYPIVAHWAWATEGGSAVGWLRRIGFIDQAGSTIVHGVGAWAALAVVLQLGPRRGWRRDHASHLQNAASSNLVLSTLGVFLLWFGWFGFNAGSAYSNPSAIPRILMNTLLAPAAGGSLWLMCQAATGRVIELRPIVAGVIGGLVAVTAGCGLFEPWQAIVIGAVGGGLAMLSARLIEHLGIDDPLDAIACHGVAGVFGTVAIPLLANADTLPLARLPQLQVQLLGVAAVFAFSFLAVSAATFLLRAFLPLRVTARDEEIGLSVAEHGAHSEFQELMRLTRNEQTQALYRDDDPTRVVDDFSEYGVLRTAVDEMIQRAQVQESRLHTVIQETHTGAVEMLVDLCEYRDSETAAHIKRIQLYSAIVAEEMSRRDDSIDRGFIEDLRLSSVLHDIGKVGIPDELLLKPGRFTPDERRRMEAHTTIGAEILGKAQKKLGPGARFLPMAVDVARSHHERYDGAGYPNGLAGEAIPLAARIVAVVDAFDALASRRVYKEAIRPTEARAVILADTGAHFDPEVVAAFTARFEDLVRVQRRYADEPANGRTDGESPTEREPAADSLAVSI